MKRFVLAALCALTVLSLAACGGKLSDKQIRNDFIESGFAYTDSYTLDSFEIKDRAEEDGTLTVTVAASLSNYFSERTVACDMLYTAEDGDYTLTDCRESSKYDSTLKLTADTLTDDAITVLAVGCSDYRSSNGSMVYPNMFVVPDTSTYAGYDTVAREGDVTVTSYSSDLEKQTAYATVEMKRSSDYITVNQTVNFAYYFDVDALAWRVLYADVTSSSVSAADGMRLTCTAMIGGKNYNIVYTGVNSDGTLQGTVDGVDISGTQFAGSRVYGPNIIVRPHGGNQTWYYLIFTEDLTSMYTTTSKIEASPVLDLSRFDTDAEQ